MNKPGIEQSGINRIPILYVIGAGRSGTTLLSCLLELEDDYRAIGEVRYIGDPETWPHPCGCGKPQEECEVWGPLLHRWRNIDALAQWNSAMRARQLDQLVVSLSPRRPRPVLQHGLVQLESVYAALSEPGTVLVDESKTPWPGYLLAIQPWADVRFVELVRHPQEVIDSWGRRKAYSPTAPPEQVARNWLRAHVTADFVRLRTGRPWLRMPYNSLVNDPGLAVTRILGRPSHGLRQEQQQWVFDAPYNHIYLSNPDKLKRGRQVIRPTGSKEAPARSAAGKWQYLAIKYWDHRLSGQTELTRNWGR
jgi:hypothetical protein